MPDSACSLFRLMISDGCTPTHFTLATILGACQESGPERFSFGVQVHGLVSKTQYVFDTMVCHALVLMCGSCCLESPGYACHMFDGMATRNLVSWTLIIAVDSHRGNVGSAFELFLRMQEEVFWVGLRPSEHTFGSLIILTYNCVSGLCLLDQLLARVSKSGFLSNLYVGSALVCAFAKFVSLDKSRKLLVQMSNKNVVSMNGLMVGLIKQNLEEEAIKVFRETGDSIEMNSD